MAHWESAMCQKGFVFVTLLCTVQSAIVVDVPMGEITGYRTRMGVVRVSPSSNAPIVEKGDYVTVHATGVVKETGSKFWSTKDKGQRAFTYQAGVGGVITGWDQGVMGARVGEIRKLDIPSSEGYGDNGFPAWGIPAGGSLEFTIEVLSIRGKEGDRAGL